MRRSIILPERKGKVYPKTSYDMYITERSRDTAVHMLTLGARCEWSTPRPTAVHKIKKKEPRYPLHRRLEGPLGWLRLVWRRPVLKRCLRESRTLLIKSVRTSNTHFCEIMTKFFSLSKHLQHLTNALRTLTIFFYNTAQTVCH